MNTKWTHKVRKESRVIGGQFSQMPTAATGTLDECLKYAEAFADAQRAAGVGRIAATRIVVLSRGGARAKTFPV